MALGDSRTEVTEELRRVHTENTLQSQTDFGRTGSNFINVISTLQNIITEYNKNTRTSYYNEYYKTRQDFRIDDNKKRKLFSLEKPVCFIH